MRLFVWLDWTAFAASALILLHVSYGAGTFLDVFGLDLIKPCMIAPGNFAKNGRGDLVEGQTRDCAIIGTAAEDWHVKDTMCAPKKPPRRAR